MKAHRLPIVPLSLEADFHNLLWDWWIDMQPSGRLVNGLLMQHANMFDWKSGAVRKSGASGVFLFLVAVVWAGLDVPIADIGRRSSWLSAVADITWALNDAAAGSNQGDNRSNTKR
jgi:hypothetical protein